MRTTELDTCLGDEQTVTSTDMDTGSVEIVLDAAGIAKVLDRLSREIFESLPHGTPLAIIGMRSRGEIIAARLVSILQKLCPSKIEVGTLDITLYRDDLAKRGPDAMLRKTEIDFDIDGRYIILVDDVLYTGRSVRAALDAIVDLGRPEAIRLAVLVERPGRELPIQADFVGLQVSRPDVPVTVRLKESDGIDEVRVG